MPVFPRLRPAAYPARARWPVRPSFRDRRFVFLVAGEMVNSIGGWASAIALWGFAAYRFDASPPAVSLLIVCWVAPPALFSAAFGVVVDRIGPWQALVLGYLAAAGAALALAVAGSLAEVDAAAAFYGLTRALAGPAAAALPPRIVSADDLLAANSLLGAAGPTGQILGPLAASATFALAGFRAAFLLDAVTYLLGVAAVAALPHRPMVAGARPGWGRQLVEGLAVVARRRRLRLVVTLGAAVSFTSGAFLVVEPLYARDVLNRPPSQFALFEAAAGTGAVLASFMLPRFRARLDGRRSVAAAAFGYGIGACLFTGTTAVPVAYAGAFAWGITGAVFYTVAVTSLQRLAPLHAHGRVMALSSALQSVCDTIGLPLAGPVLAVFGIRAGAIGLAAVAVVSGLGGLLAHAERSR